MKKTSAAKKVLLSLYHYFCFFLLMAFVISCCMLLFLETMSQSMGITFTEENINTAAIITFGNVMFLSFLCTLIDGIRRKFTVDRHVKKIVAAAEQVSHGDYSARIPAIKSINRADGLDEIAECFNKMAEELSSVETLQTDFIANVSHELKTPLAIIQNYGSLLQQPDLTEEDRLRYADAISHSSNRLATLVSDILKLNKLENRQIYPSVDRYDLKEQLCECLLGFENIWEDKSIKLESTMEDGVYIDADPELLSVVWNNLFSNAFKFTDINGKVSVTLTADTQFAVVEVTDSGCGISPENGKHIFDKFYQADASHSTEGNGLGLALVRRVMDIIGGDISVTSEIGVGSTFTVKLRRADNE